jgi:magnesium transporter
MIIDCAQYLDGKRLHRGAMSLEEAAARRHDDGVGFMWLGLFEPSVDELDQVRKAFDLHELAVEDAQTFHMRPKIERYGDGVDLVILRTAYYDDEREEVDFGEISVFVGPDFVIAVRQGVASELASARARLEQHPELLSLGPASVLWAVLDQVIDSYGPVVAGLEQDIDEVEETVFAGSVAPTERIYLLRREVTNFYRAVHPLLAVLTYIERAGGKSPLRPYFRDVADDLLLVNEEVSAQRDLLATILEANMAVISVEQTQISVRQSTTMERLTIMATVFLPLTFVTGFFGQNFGWLADHISGPWAFLVFGIGGLLVPLVLLWMWLRNDRGRQPPAIAFPPRPLAHGAPRQRQSTVPAVATPHSSARVAALRPGGGPGGVMPSSRAGADRSVGKAAARRPTGKSSAAKSAAGKSSPAKPPAVKPEAAKGPPAKQQAAEPAAVKPKEKPPSGTAKAAGPPADKPKDAEPQSGQPRAVEPPSDRPAAAEPRSEEPAAAEPPSDGPATTAPTVTSAAKSAVLPTPIPSVGAEVEPSPTPDPTVEDARPATTPPS